MSIPRAIVLSVALLSGAASAAEPEVFNESSNPFGTLKRVVEPAYPKALVESGQGGEVEISGTLGWSGVLENPSYKASSDAARAFIEPLREVVPYWTFYQGTDNECQPIEQRVAVRASFEVVDGKPKMSVLHASYYQKPRTLAPLKKVYPEYPRRAQQRGHEAVVFTAADIAPDGSIEAVRSSVYPRNESTTIFRENVREAVLKWIFPSGEPGSKRRMCLVFTYRLV